MSASTRSTAGAARCRGRFYRLARVFVMSFLGTIVLGAAFWPPRGFERRLIVAFEFDERLSAEERKQEFDRIERSLLEDEQVRAWAADADSKARPSAFVLSPLASLAPVSARAEATLSATSVESDGMLVGAEIRFSDADAIRAERFAQAIVDAFASAPVGSGASAAEPTTALADRKALDAAAERRQSAVSETLRRQEELKRAIETHFEELRSLRSKLSQAAGPEQDRSLSLSTASDFLWQVASPPSRQEIERRLAELDAEIAKKRSARDELLTKFTSHHPVAAALTVAVERLERERRELTALLAAATAAPGAGPRPAPEGAAVPAPARPNPSRTQSSPSASSTTPGSRSSAPDAAAERLAAERIEAARQEARRDAEQRFAAERAEFESLLEETLRGEAALQEELSALAETAERLAKQEVPPTIASSSEPSEAAALAPASLRGRVLDGGVNAGVGARFGTLVLVALVFAAAMTGLSWLVGRERAVTSAEEVRSASGLPVIGQTSAGLLDRTPRRDVAGWAVGGAQKLVEGAAFATAVFCVAALAAENPRCVQILRQPLAVAWQALESLT